ncbi:MAG: hypothetical protein GX639_12390 [Fibrobacter sp.]|nr:hypothetical protein [Fibrobacter sp.]
MRRVLATLGLILATSSAVSTVSAAEVKLGAWGRGFFVPFFSDGDSDAQTFDAASWGANYPRIGVSIIGSSDNAGFQIDLNGDNGIGAHDQQKIWIKPFNMLTVTIGRAYDDVLRGNGAFGDFNWLRISGTGEDFTFHRVSTHDGAYAPVVTPYDQTKPAPNTFGSIIALDPMKELHAYVAFKSLTTSMKTEDAFKNIQVGLGYNIAEKAHIRAQYVGVTTPGTGEGDEADASVINAALKLTLTESFYADLGTFIPTDKAVSAYTAKIAAYINYKTGAIALHGLGNFVAGTKNVKGDDATGMELGLGFDYAIGDNGLGFVSSFRYQNDAFQGGAGVEDGRIGGLVGIQKGFSNGKIGIGFEFSTTNMAFNGGEPAPALEKATIAVPVIVEYSF